MRIINVLRNSFYSISTFIFISLLGIIVRKFFVQYLPIELLGLEGLFANIITLLSLAELGITNVISYGLYREIANDNKEEINILMNIYRYIYMIIGSIVFVISIILFICLPIIIKEPTISWNYIYFVYVIQIGVILSSYFLAYKRTLFLAAQKDYICIKVDMCCNSLNNIVRLIAIVVFQSYFIYASTSLFFNILANIIISSKVKKEYPFLRLISVSYRDMKERKIFKDIKNFLIHKISYIVYSGIDILIVSSFLGLNMAGLLSNYILIYTGIYSILYKLLQGIRPSIGNLVYSSDIIKSYKIYNTLDLAYIFLGGYVACIYVIVFQDFISLFFGKEFLLPNEYIIALAFNVFLGMQFENAYNFRSTHGNFENDRIYMIYSAISKLVISIIGIKLFGIVGIMLGTIVGLFFIVYGRIQFVFRIIFKRSLKEYIKKHIIISCIIWVEIILIYYFFNNIYIIPYTYWGLFFKCVIISIILLILQYILFYKTEEFKDICIYLRKIGNIIFNKIKGKG